MWVDVKIPYDENRRLAEAYHRAVAEGSSEWVLLLDQDVFLCNPHWYDMCLEAINTLHFGDRMAAGVGCECGGERFQKDIVREGDAYVPPNSDIEYHIKIAKDKYYDYGNMLQRVHVPLCGYFMLLKRSVALEIGFNQRKKSINNIDTDFGQRVMEAGYHLYQLRGLYVYHRRGMRHLRKEFIIRGNET